MSKDEIKYEINKILDNFSDNALQDLLKYLKNLETTHQVSMFDKKDLERILIEDKDLLKKLSQ
jgi:hypothetical protein